VSDLDSYIEERKRTDKGFAEGLDEGYEQFRIEEILRQAREAAGLTQEELADRVHTKKTATSRIENHAEDIFPKMWENQKKGTRGYSPACASEWVRGVCDKPRTKCSACPNRAFVPFDETIARGHLEGTFTVGS
jgi:hypothetical protein